MGALQRVVEEAPFRLLSYFLVRRLAKSVRTIDRWAATDRPNYFAGILAAADQAVREGVPEISVFEFGVAGGTGLIALQTYAEIIEMETGVRIQVFGFDTGEGLPPPSPDFRDHPDQWKAHDYKMDVGVLKSRLTPRTQLVLGDIANTLPRFVAERHAPTGFVACDVDLYSSTLHVLKIFTLTGKRMLRKVPLYFDDIDFPFNHRFAGELLAISEFNQSSNSVKIDRWRGIRKERVFQNQSWLDKMFMAHDLEAISNVSLARQASTDCELLAVT